MYLVTQLARDRQVRKSHCCMGGFCWCCAEKRQWTVDVVVHTKSLMRL
jgi:hypothetical protein